MKQESSANSSLAPGFQRSAKLRAVGAGDGSVANAIDPRLPIRNDDCSSGSVDSSTDTAELRRLSLHTHIRRCGGHFVTCCDNFPCVSRMFVAHPKKHKFCRFHQFLGGSQHLP